MITKLIAASGCILLSLATNSCSSPASAIETNEARPVSTISETKKLAIDSATYYAALYNRLQDRLANGDTSRQWPVKTDYPLPGAILPYKRVIAFYGNLYVKGMGILGEIPPDDMLKKLQGECLKWQEADSLVKVQPALHYIAVTAQSSPGAKKLYRLRMPFHQIDTVLSIARKIDAIVFLDIQVGHSRLQDEIPELKKYLEMPNVHLGIDPEFSMKGEERPGAKVGTFDAADINYAMDYLAVIVKQNHIPPKILVIHRFTENMVTGSEKIKLLPEVQVVMHMDGFGFPAKKIDTYKRFVARQPVQYTGFKVFYKNDILDRRWPQVMRPDELLKLSPQPSYIQYQ